MKKVLIGVAILLLIPVTWFSLRTVAGIYRSMFSPYLTWQVAGPLVIGPNETRIKPEVPLRAERQIQQLILDFETPMEPNYAQWGVGLPDGSVVVPRAEFVDQYGNIYVLKVTGLDHTGMAFSYPSDLPRDRQYLAVKLTADKPIRLGGVRWKCWNPWDVS